MCLAVVCVEAGFSQIWSHMYDETMSVEGQDVAIVYIAKCIAAMMNVQIHIVHSWLVS